MTKAQQRALATLAGQPYGVVSIRMAQALIADGLASRVVVSPAPARGIAVRLTARGRAQSGELADPTATPSPV